MSDRIMIRIMAWTVFILLMLAAAAVRASEPETFTFTGKETLIVLDGPVEGPIVKSAAEQLLVAPKNPILWINSPGGDIIAGMSLVDI